MKDIVEIFLLIQKNYPTETCGVILFFLVSFLFICLSIFISAARGVVRGDDINFWFFKVESSDEKIKRNLISLIDEKNIGDKICRMYNLAKLDYVQEEIRRIDDKLLSIATGEKTLIDDKFYKFNDKISSILNPDSSTNSQLSEDKIEKLKIIFDNIHDLLKSKI